MQLIIILLNDNDGWMGRGDLQRRVRDIVSMKEGGYLYHQWINRLKANGTVRDFAGAIYLIKKVTN